MSVLIYHVYVKSSFWVFKQNTAKLQCFELPVLSNNSKWPATINANTYKHSSVLSNPRISKSWFYRMPYSVLFEQWASRYIKVTETLQLVARCLGPRTIWTNIVADCLIITDVSGLEPSEVPGYKITFKMDSSLNKRFLYKQLDQPKYISAPAKRQDWLTCNSYDWDT